MVAEDLLVANLPAARLLLQPVRVLLVQLAARSLRQAAVGGVTDEDVAEPVGRLVHERRSPRPHELATDEVFEQRRGAVGGLGGKCEDGTDVEELPLDRAVLEQRSLARLQPVESLGEQRVDGRRDREVGEVSALCPAPVRRLPHEAVFDEDGQQLLHEQGHPGCGFDHAFADLLL